MLLVKKKDGLIMLRDQNGYPYPEGEFNTTPCTYVSRLLKSGDLIDINKLTSNKEVVDDNTE